MTLKIPDNRPSSEQKVAMAGLSFRRRRDNLSPLLIIVTILASLPRATRSFHYNIVTPQTIALLPPSPHHPTAIRSLPLLPRHHQQQSQLPSPPSFRTTTARYASLSSNDDDDDSSSPPVAKIDPTVERAAISLRRACLVSWWAQVVLTTVSAVTLLFARGVVRNEISSGPLTSGSGFVLAGTGIFVSVLSIIWTYGGRRLSRRLTRRNTTRQTATLLLRRAITVGVSLNLIGMFVTLVGAELIVGVLAAKALTTQGASSLGAAGGGLVASQVLQPLDVLIVQANTNTLLSHFCGLWLRLWYGRKWIGRLQPVLEGAEEG